MLIPPNGIPGSMEAMPIHTVPVIWEIWASIGVVSMLILSMINHKTFPRFFLHLFLISLPGWLIHLSLWGILTGNAAQLWSVDPPMILAATPVVAVFASNSDVPLSANSWEISFKSTDFPVPPGPCTITRCCEGFQLDRCWYKCQATISHVTHWCAFNLVHCCAVLQGGSARAIDTLSQP